MVYVYLEGHNFEHETFELIRLFFKEDLIFINGEEEYDGNGILIINSLIETKDNFSCVTNVKSDGDSISSYSIDSIKDIDIKTFDIHKKIKLGIKKSIYYALSSTFNIELPWGILTGVRPVKIVNELMDDGYGEDVIYEILKNEYLLSKQKAMLIIEVAKNQRRFIWPLKEDRYNLYVNIPFCPTRCIYCSFPSNSIEQAKNYIDEYTKCVIYELKHMSQLLKGKKINTVYIGGGTPTSIPIKNLESIISSIYELFGNENINEITVEAGRPDTLNMDMLKMLKAYEIDRISINPQSMNQSTLRLIGRYHTNKDVIDAFNLAREIGFNLINMDIIVGLPGEGIDELTYTLDAISKLRPENLTVHTLAIKRGSKFISNLDMYSLTDGNTISNMLKLCGEYAENMGLKPYYLYRQKQMLGNYENIGYSLDDRECIYNILIMEERETIIAVGAGGVSKIFYPKENRIERVPNVKGLHDYLTRVDEMILRKKHYIDS